MRRGVTIVEIMMVLILMTLVLGALYRIFSSAQRGAQEVMSNQIINDDVLRLINKITDDLREANFIDEHLPPTFNDETQARNFAVLDPKNQLMFNKIKYDFTKDPATLAPDQVNYTQLRVVYSVKKMDPGQATGPYALFRETLPFDDRRKAVHADKTKVEVMNNIDHLVFYRLKNPRAPRHGNLYLHLRMTRLDRAGPTTEKFTVDITTSVKERGGEPE